MEVVALGNWLWVIRCARWKPSPGRQEPDRREEQRSRSIHFSVVGRISVECKHRRVNAS